MIASAARPSAPVTPPVEVIWTAAGLPGSSLPLPLRSSPTSSRLFEVCDPACGTSSDAQNTAELVMSSKRTGDQEPWNSQAPL